MPIILITVMIVDKSNLEDFNLLNLSSYYEWACERMLSEDFVHEFWKAS